MHAGLEPQIGTMQHRLQEAARGAPSPAATLIDLEIGRALVVAGVEIRDLLDAGHLGRVADRVENRPTHPRRLDPPFPARPMKLVGRRDVILVLEEERQHIVPTPTFETELTPALIVGGLSAHVDHRVDGRRAPDDLAPRVSQRAAVQAGFDPGREEPIGALVADRKEIAGRNVEPDPIVEAAGFQHEHALGGISREAIGQDAARRPRADDDVVVRPLESRAAFRHAPIALPTIRERSTMSRRNVGRCFGRGRWRPRGHNRFYSGDRSGGAVTQLRTYVFARTLAKARCLR